MNAGRDHRADPRRRRQPGRPGAAGPVPGRRGPRGDRGRQRRAGARAPARRRRGGRCRPPRPPDARDGRLRDARGDQGRRGPGPPAGHRHQRPRRARLGRPLHRDGRGRLPPATVQAAAPAGPDRAVAGRQAAARPRARARSTARPRRTRCSRSSAARRSTSRPSSTRSPSRPAGCAGPTRVTCTWPATMAMYRLVAATAGGPASTTPGSASTRIAPADDTVAGRVVLTGQVVQVDDVLADPEYDWPAARDDGVPHAPRRPDPAGRAVDRRHRPGPDGGPAVRRGARSLLVSTFAEQAAIAIENARLVETIERQRTELARFLSPQIAALVSSAEGEALLAGHRRQITAVFCDLRGFTHFSRDGRAGGAARGPAGLPRAMGALVVEHGGTLEHFAGDGMLVFFNDPVAQDDHAQRAVGDGGRDARARSPSSRGLAQARATSSVSGSASRPATRPSAGSASRAATTTRRSATSSSSPRA